MAEPAKKSATYADLEAVPPHLVAEIIDGELVTHPRPFPRHGLASNALAAQLTNPFQNGRGGPGGWVFIDEPELHLGPNVVVPDLAGWRRERLLVLPDTAYLEVAPDWVCEVLSASTEMRDRTTKRRIYAQAGIGHFWLIDPRQQLLEAFELSGAWTLTGTWAADEVVGAPPFEAISFSLADLWPLDRPLGLVKTLSHSMPETGRMLSLWALAAITVPTTLLAIFVRRMSSRFDAILLMISGAASLLLAVVATTAMQAKPGDGMMGFEMSEQSFNFGVLPPVFVVATLTVMRGIFKFIGE